MLELCCVDIGASAGRAGNSWESPKGCLMFSFTLQMSDGRAVPFLQYVVSLAVIEGIESHCTSKVCAHALLTVAFLPFVTVLSSVDGPWLYCTGIAALVPARLQCTVV